MSNFIDEYKKLLIIQYSDKPKAKAHIELILSQFEDIYQLCNSFNDAFDIDLAVGKQLDIIGKIAGINRVVSFTVPKKYFGFWDNGSIGMRDLFDDSNNSLPFKNLFEIPYTAGELNDTDYKYFIRAKVMKNFAKATMIDENRLSLQNAVDFIFKNKAYVVDNQDMSFTICIEDTANIDMLQYVIRLDLIPRPQGVEIKMIIKYSKNTFGFWDNGATGMRDLFDENSKKGKFAEMIIY